MSRAGDKGHGGQGAEEVGVSDDKMWDTAGRRRLETTRGENVWECTLGGTSTS